VIDADTILRVIVGALGVWAAGFSVGKTVAWVREILNAA
jgi:hypothetical protein